jgi:hypothetical protein
MKRTICIFFAGLIFINYGLLSCKKEEAGTGSKTSVNNGTESHNVGESCMSCHNTDGSNEYWWIVAGTVYKPDNTSLNPNSTVYLYKEANGGGTVVLTLPADAKGNFYTTGSVSFGTGLFPAVKSSSGQIRFMGSSITQGNCNGCHTSSNRIIVN